MLLQNKLSPKQQLWEFFSKIITKIQLQKCLDLTKLIDLLAAPYIDHIQYRSQQHKYQPWALRLAVFELRNYNNILIHRADMHFKNVHWILIEASLPIYGVQELCSWNKLVANALKSSSYTFKSSAGELFDIDQRTNHQTDKITPKFRF